MQFKISDTIPMMIRLINDDGQEIQWQITGLFDKKMYLQRPWLFTHINQFWNGYGEWKGIQRETKNKIFDIYRQIWDILANIYNGEIANREERLAELIKELFEEHKLSKIKMYMIFSDIKMPAGLKSVYEHNQEQVDKNHTSVKTYLLEDYKELIALSLQMRLMIPIWTVYLYHIKKSIGTNFKEMHAFDLLRLSNIVEDAPFKKLCAYVNSCIPSDQDELIEKMRSNIMDGISTDDYPKYLISGYVVRKLPLNDVRGINFINPALPAEPILVQHLATTINENIKAESRNIDTRISSKIDKDQSSNDSEENQVSVFENYKIKEDISRGDIQYLLHCVSNPYQIAKIIEPTTPDSLIESTLKFVDKISASEATDAQTVLLSWMINTIIPGEAVEYMDRLIRAKCLCACSAAYWTKGHKVIAALCTATPIISDVVYNNDASKNSGKIDSATLKVLEELFPYVKIDRKGYPEETIKDNIEILITLLRKKAWELNLTVEQLDEINQGTASIHFPLPPNTRQLIAELIIEICNQQKDQRERRAKLAL